MNPERIYKYTTPVTAVAFSKQNCQLLAIGLYNGTIEVVDITDLDCAAKVSFSQRDTSPPIEPIWQIKWIKRKKTTIGCFTKLM